MSHSRRGRGGMRGGGGYSPNKVRYSSREPLVYKKILNERTHRILIRERNVKVVLGPEGQNIKAIKSKCKGDCRITIFTQAADGEPFPPDSVDRIINIDSDFEDLETILNQLIPYLQVAAPDKMVNRFNEIRLVVPDFVCSTIIGPKGTNVKNIQKDLRSFVQVHKDILPYSSEHIVSLTNKDVKALAESTMRVYESFKTIKSISHVTLYNPSVWYIGEWGDTGSYLDFPDSPHGTRDEYVSRRQEYPARNEYPQRNRSSQERPLPQQRFSTHHVPRYTAPGYVPPRQHAAGYDDSVYPVPQASDCPTCGHTESYPPPLPRRPKSDGRGYNSGGTRR